MLGELLVAMRVHDNVQRCAELLAGKSGEELLRKGVHVFFVISRDFFAFGKLLE